MNLTIHEVDYHRNGSWGTGFYVIRFRDNDLGREFVGTVFGHNPTVYRDSETPYEFYDPIYEDPHVAVLDVDLVKSTVRFGENSWRGGNYADDLYLAIDAFAEGKDADMNAYIAANRKANDEAAV